MTLFINRIISSVIQIIIFALIPFVWWLVSARKKEKFSKWIGLKKPNGNAGKISIAVAVISLVFMISGAVTLYVLKDIEMATSEFTGLGISALPAILIYAAFNTSFPEELFFRGFLLKRISDKSGLVRGNCIQAVLFAFLHGGMFISAAGMLKTIIIIMFTGVIAYSMGYVNEKMAKGSIIPGWIIHCLSNIFSGLCAAFMIF